MAVSEEPVEVTILSTPVVEVELHHDQEGNKIGSREQDQTVDDLDSLDSSPCRIEENIISEVPLSLLNPAELRTVKVVLDGREISALIDTGASRSLVQQKIVESHILSESRVEFQGLGEGEFHSVGDVLLDVGMGSVNFKQQFCVVPTNSIKYDMLIGDDFLKKNGVLVDVARGKLSSSLGRGSFEVYMGKEQHRVYRNLDVYLTSDTRLISGESQLVEAHLGVNGDILSLDKNEALVEESSKVLPKRNVHLEAGIVSVHRGKLQILLTSDNRSKPGVLHKNTRIGSLSSIVEVSIVNPTIVQPGEEMDVKISELLLSHLTDDEALKVRETLRRCSRAISKGDEDIGLAGVTQHRIELHDDTPIRQKPRRFPDPVTEEIEAQCEDLLKMGVIEFSKSAWSAPVVPIRKKDGSIRLCVDYRKLNKVTKADRFPMPCMNDLVFSLQGSRYFTALDLVRGYYQVPLDPETAEYTAFSTPRNHYQFRRLSFGLKNAPGAFQREMQEVLRDFDSKQVVVYIDDILILGKSFEEHLHLVERVLATLSEYGMKIKLHKCEWFKTEVQFLGHIVNRNGVRKCPEYVESVRSFPKPETVKQLRSFLGLVNFQRKFIPNCSLISKPLNSWLGKTDKLKIRWDTEMEDSFRQLKESMATEIELTYPNYAEDAEPLMLSSDASRFGAGACLTQEQNGETRVIAYASTTFNKAQINYSTIEQELAAIRWAVHIFRGFILGVKFLLFTDHRPLIFMANMSKCNTRITRTLNELAEYDFDIKFRPGKENFVADTLSRLPCPVIDECQKGQLVCALPEGIHLLKKVDGGGNSLVDSLWELLKVMKMNDLPELDVPRDSLGLRRKIHTELTNHSSKYGLSKERSEKLKLKLSFFDGQVPPDEFIMVFCSMFSLDVWVHHGTGKPIQFHGGEGGTSRRRLHLQCLAGCHFNPATESKFFTPVQDLPEHEDEIVEEIEEFEICEEPLVNLDEPIVSQCTCDSTPCTARVLIRFGSRICCAVVDTGAMISVIRDDIWWSLTSEERFSMNFSPKTVNIRGVSGSMVRTTGMVEAVWSLVDQADRNVSQFAIMKYGDLPVCAILGANILAQCKLVLDYSGGRLICDADAKWAGASFLQPSTMEFYLEFCLQGELVAGVVGKGIAPEAEQVSTRSIRLLYRMIKGKVALPKWKNSLKFF